MIKDLIKLANTLDQMGYRTQADLLDSLIKSAGEVSPAPSEAPQTWAEYTQMLDERAEKADEEFRSKYKSDEPSKKTTEIGHSSHEDMILKKYNLSDEHLVNKPGDPYSYVYVPNYKGKAAWLITSGPSDHRAFDEVGNPINQSRMLIRKDQPGWNVLKPRIPRKHRVEESTHQTRTKEGKDYHSKWSLLGEWHQFRDKDNKVLYYTDNRSDEKRVAQYTGRCRGVLCGKGLSDGFYAIDLGPIYWDLSPYPDQTSGRWRMLEPVGTIVDPETSDPQWKRVE